MALTLGDFNGDGVTDIASVRYESYGATGEIAIMLGTTQSGVSAMQEFSLKTKSDSLQAMGIIDRTLQNLGQQRGTIGANQSRIGVALNNLLSSRDNFKAAESRIRDADVASDSAQLIRTQILQQAGVAVLAQANTQPQIALALLR